MEQTQVDLCQQIKHTNDDKTVSEYMQSIKTIIDDLAMIGHDLTHGKIIVHALDELTPEFKQMKVVVQAKESPIFFEELLEKLLDQKNSPKRDDTLKDTTPPTAQFN
ncbi:hypothetical protein PanWU01x14_155910 [Parasponia andersonii]|uniref:Uncharacterized protein n=1 Tax=Parasponia andersonii TaxID=3476 RepID=A0A2P5CGA8_PARAD|nr:hypothetical protein PanWU01x14_155910 [Parasponia andersonii]